MTAMATVPVVMTPQRLAHLPRRTYVSMCVGVVSKDKSGIRGRGRGGRSESGRGRRIVGAGTARQSDRLGFRLGRLGVFVLRVLALGGNGSGDGLSSFLWHL